jgi:hypothetical protein
MAKLLHGLGASRVSAFVLFLAGAASLATAADPGSPAAWLQPHRADYDAEPRLPNGQVDVDFLLTRLKQLHATAYYWLVWHAASDWDDLQLFLPKAAEANISVWVYLVPPSESRPRTTRDSEPFRTDYPRWAAEIARLSLRHPNLAAWVIDDFYANRKFFTPAYIAQMQQQAHAVNPRLRFLPLMYFREITPHFVREYRAVVDGVVVAYPRDRAEIELAAKILSGASVMPDQLSCPSATRTVAGDLCAGRCCGRRDACRAVRASFS